MLSKPASARAVPFAAGVLVGATTSAGVLLVLSRAGWALAVGTLAVAVVAAGLVAVAVTSHRRLAALTREVQTLRAAVPAGALEPAGAAAEPGRAPGIADDVLPRDPEAGTGDDLGVLVDLVSVRPRTPLDDGPALQLVRHRPGS